jgi:D-serine deaminase-like pyridoxal phosphate-dependent protein
LKIDVGTHRTGFSPDEKEEIEKTFDIIDNQSLITFKGFLAHAGHTYNARSHAEIEQIYHQSISILQLLKNEYLNRYPNIEISVGDTPSCSVMNDFSGVNEIRPGNFVFYDLMQANISSCQEAQIAVALACPIIAKHKKRLQIVIQGGAVHLSKDNVVLENGQKYFGKIVKLQENGWSEAIEGLSLVSLSQEHGIIQATPETFDLFQIGDEIGILPIHSCLVADLMGEFSILSGDFQV